MPETAAGRSLLDGHNESDTYLGWVENSYDDTVAAVDAIEAEARALGRAEARTAVDRVVLNPTGRTDYFEGVADFRSKALVAIDNLETP